MAQGSSGATNLRDRGYSSSTDGYKSNTSTPSPQQNNTISTSSQVSCGASSSSSSSTNTSSSSVYEPATSASNKSSWQEQIKTISAQASCGAGSGGKIITTLAGVNQIPQSSFNISKENINLSGKTAQGYPTNTSGMGEIIQAANAEITKIITQTNNSKPIAKYEEVHVNNPIIGSKAPTQKAEMKILKKTNNIGAQHSSSAFANSSKVLDINEPTIITVRNEKGEIIKQEAMKSVPDPNKPMIITVTNENGKVLKQEAMKSVDNINKKKESKPIEVYGLNAEKLHNVYGSITVKAETPSSESKKKENKPIEVYGVDGNKIHDVYGSITVAPDTKQEAKPEESPVITIRDDSKPYYTKQDIKQEEPPVITIRDDSKPYYTKNDVQHQNPDKIVTSTTSPQYSSMGLPLNEPLSNNNNQKTLSHEGTIDSSDIDYSKIAILADRASSGQFINDETIYKDLCTDLTYEERPDGTYVIKKGDTKMGFTTKDGFIGYSN